MKPLTFSKIVLSVFVSIVLVQCTLTPSDLTRNNSDISFDLIRVDDLNDKNISWDYEESYQTIFYDENLNSGLTRKASKSLVGYYGQADIKLFLMTQVEQFAESIKFSEVEEISLGFIPDTTISPVISEVGLEQRAKCAEKESSEGELGYFACAVQIQLDNKNLYSIFLHGDGRIKEVTLETLLDDIMDKLQSKLDAR